jgi:DNA-binding response OmpR family regulator
VSNLRAIARASSFDAAATLFPTGCSCVENDRVQLQQRAYGPRMQLRLLGPLQLHDAAGSVHAGGPKERTVLAVLAIDAGAVVPESHLIEALWPDDPPRTAARTLQSYISRLRMALAAPDDSLLIDAVPGGYRLRAGHGVDEL